MDASPIRIVSYNVRYFSQPLRGLASTTTGQRRIAARLAALTPHADVVCLQEVESTSLRSRGWRRPGQERSQLDDFLMELAAEWSEPGTLSPYRGLYFPGHVTRLGHVPLASSGLAILVNARRFQIASHNAAAPWRITTERVDPLRGARYCAHARLVDAQGRPLHVFNTHLSLPLPLPQVLFWALPLRLGGARNQVEEGRSLSALVRRHARDEPFVLCGDFNSTPGSRVHRHLVDGAGLRDAHAAVRGDPPSRPSRATPTFAAARVRLHLDHLFCGGGAAWLDLEGTYAIGARESPFVGLSDHAPVIARLELPQVAVRGGEVKRERAVPIPEQPHSSRRDP